MKSSLSAGERYGVPLQSVNANCTSIPFACRSTSSGSTRSATQLRHTQQRRAMSCRFVPYIARSLLGIRKEPKKQKPPESGGGRGLRGLCFSPPHRALCSGLKAPWRLVFSLTFRLPDGSWKPSLLMSIYNVHLSSVGVKRKVCIYNYLRLTPGVDCTKGKGQGATWESPRGRIRTNGED